MMKALLVLAAALLVPADDPAKSDLDKLQGTWLLVAMETGEHTVPAEQFQDWNAHYEGNRLSLRVKEKVRRRGIVTLEATRNPKAMNTWDQDGPYEDKTLPGIYELNGDTLRVCFARPGEERPKEFNTKAGNAFLLCVYQRQKP